MKTPVAFIIFKRPDTTEKVFEVIRQAKPPKLLVIADGPRADKLGEAEKCAAARAIIDRVDWDCEVLTNYSEINLGCAKRVSSGLDWVFDNVEDAIILEDDCVPNPTFFQFCEELLERYKDDHRIFSISAQNVQLGSKRTEYSYYFSRYNHCWGWATWKRAWQHFDFDMKLWPEVREKRLLYEMLGYINGVKYWEKNFQATYEHQRDSWSYRWTFACWIQRGLTIIPNVNLVSNIGFGADSTHYKKNKSKFNNAPTEAIEFPLKHPPFVMRNMNADIFTQKTIYSHRWLKELKARIKNIIRTYIVRS
ncbi:MAG TPA: hemolytic protein HlpA-like protein [Cyanobacteria bacterium UBA11149]|nr:hemolytic protein HlpA-like protein [Cyanobacteria bacterium UBA11367]HBE60117.1 hemolytic protein HlpA-like protein [Cyanobacteria bacterium UBA11366]HBK62693.1 hemolytic protein HlpA-like protein [Cyanobacteria bacterium UBA11166]HBR72549.1 hemolytic protein HlpA-like protein [Cyanobacteria bacterium UBA11159]HBS71646.1 hemolytic protein HlpA-like protein [Cyanobacteria bacterium UBA11153]HBW90160.1 hemolytic protein HlpA-like protein [Cyanobacteria bacterium UBA11149]HCA97731.1 hemolyti